MWTVRRVCTLWWVRACDAVMLPRANTTMVEEVAVAAEKTKEVAAEMWWVKKKKQEVVPPRGRKRKGAPVRKKPAVQQRSGLFYPWSNNSCHLFRV